jgi:fibronectin-binding autotransporter adhesin
MKIKGLARFFIGAVYLSALLLVFVTPKAHATSNTCTWTGASNNNFNTAGNWSGCGSTVPNGGDNLVFPQSAISADTTLTNDISSLSAGTITFSGTVSHTYTITGNAITVNGNITDSGYNIFDVDITLGADVTVDESAAVSGTSLGKFGGTVRTITTNGHALTISGIGGQCGVSIYAKLAGSGNVAVNLPNGGVNLYTDASSYTGAVSATAGILGVGSTGVFQGTSGVTISGTGVLGLALNGADRTYAFPVTLGGTGSTTYGSLFASKSSRILGCSGGGSDNTTYTATLSSLVTLSSDVVYYGGYVNTNVTGLFTSNGHAFSVKSGSQGTITTSQGTVTPPAETITISAGDNDPATSVNVGNNQTYIIDGVRGYTSVNSGGTLKGNGTVGGLYISQGGVVAPGHSPGCLTSNGDLTLGGKLQVEIGGNAPCNGYDQTIVNGAVTIDNLNSTPEIDINTYGSFKPAAGNTYVIISNDGSDAVTGTFAGLAEGATFARNGYVFQITYQGGDGNDVAVIVRSVPATPDTGLAYLQNRPLLTLLVTSMTAGAVVVLARIYNKRMSKQV